MQEFSFLSDEELSRRSLSKKARDAGNKIGILLLLLSVFQLGLSLIYQVVVSIIELVYPGSSSVLMSMVTMQFVLYLASFLITIFIAHIFLQMRQTRWYDDVDKTPVEMMLPAEKVHPLDFIGSVCLCLGAGMAGNLIATLLSMVFVASGLPMPEVAFEMPEGAAGIILYLVAVAFIPPLLEEIICRGFVYSLTKEYSPITTALVSGVTFALFHQNFAQYPIAFCMGFAMGFVLHRFKNIWICIVAHFINNFCVCIIEFLLLKGIVPMSAEGTLSLIYIGLFLFAGIISLILMGAMGRLKFDKAAHAPRATAKILTSPLYIVFIVICVALSIFTLFQDVIL